MHISFPDSTELDSKFYTWKSITLLLRPRFKLLPQKSLQKNQPRSSRTLWRLHNRLFSTPNSPRESPSKTQSNCFDQFSLKDTSISFNSARQTPHLTLSGHVSLTFRVKIQPQH